MPNIGFPELVIILVVVLLLFGPKKLPDFARSMGQAIREFRRASQEVVEDIHRASLEEPRAPQQSATESHSIPNHAERSQSEGTNSGPTRQL